MGYRRCGFRINPFPTAGEEVLEFYWVDAYEMAFHQQPGTVYLFGKVWVPSTASHLR